MSTSFSYSSLLFSDYSQANNPNHLLVFLDMHTIKPPDEEIVLKAAKEPVRS